MDELSPEAQKMISDCLDRVFTEENIEAVFADVEVKRKLFEERVFERRKRRKLLMKSKAEEATQALFEKRMHAAREYERKLEKEKAAPFTMSQKAIYRACLSEMIANFDSFHMSMGLGEDGYYSVTVHSPKKRHVRKE